jgi:hypothetical protein
MPRWTKFADLQPYRTKALHIPPLWPAYLVATLSRVPKNLYAQCLTERPPYCASVCAKPDAIVAPAVAAAVPATS